MTEAEWTTCADPQPMLAFLRGRASARKLRLFAAACSRRVWPLLDDLGRAAVEAAERFADGLAGPEELRQARLACKLGGGQSAWYAAATHADRAAGNAARSAQSGVAGRRPGDGEPDPPGLAVLAERAAQADLLRDLFGNPFRPAPFDPSWRTPAAVELARSIHDARGFSRLPQLAAALEAAGCRHAAVLAHCRAEGPHALGCWVVDGLLEVE